MAEFCFVEVTNDAAQRTNGSAGHRASKAMRQHVRKAVLRTRQQTKLDGRMRHFTGTSFVKSRQADSSGHIGKDDGAFGQLAPEHGLTIRRTTLTAQPVVRHPYTDHAASLVRLPVERIDYLFKSPFFRDACEPLFSVNLVEAGETGFRMEDVFPGCLTDAAYFNSLLLAISLLANKGSVTVETLRLHGRSLRDVRHRLLIAPHDLNHADVGSMLLLQGIAYRWNDVQAHEAHTTGLIHVRKCEKERESCLTHMGARAMFWSDLSASILIGSPRFGSDYYPPEVQWRRELHPVASDLLPIGFVRISDLLEWCMLECVVDIVELQQLVALPTIQDAVSTQILIDNMQASIESRLAWDHAEAPPLHPVVECVRLALLLTCFLTFNQRWPHSLIPSRLCQRLKGNLTATLNNPEWCARRDLQLWCMFVGSSAMSSRSMLENFAAWEELLQRFKDSFSGSSQASIGSDLLDRALEDYVYCGQWLSNRENVGHWWEFETWLSEGRAQLPVAY